MSDFDANKTSWQLFPSIHKMNRFDSQFETDKYQNDELTSLYPTFQNGRKMHDIIIIIKYSKATQTDKKKIKVVILDFKLK